LCWTRSFTSIYSLYFALLQILERWQFWLGIGLAAAFFIVLVYFVFRGFKSYKRHNEERKQEQQSEQKQEEQNGSQHDIENPLPPFSSKKSTLECQKTIDVDELARRTGRRKKDLITAHSKHHHHRSSSLASEAASVTSTTAASASDTVDTRL